MFENFLNWRKENGLDTIMNNYECPEYSDIVDAYPHAYYGVDKIGRPVYVDRLGSIDIVKIFEVCSTDTIFDNFYYEWEKTCRLRMYAASMLFDRQIM